MDPITISLALASIGGGLYSSNQANQSASANLDWQKQRAAEQDRFAQAARTDAYGNRVSYDKALNEWMTNLTPSQRALMLAGEREQRVSLTEDAGRNRAARERQARAGRAAEPAFDEAMAGYRFDQPESEGSIRAKIAQLLAIAKGPTGGATSNQSIRTSGNLPVVNQGAQAEGDTQRLAQTLLQARSQGLAESGARTQQHESKYGPALDRFTNMLGAGGGAPISMPSDPTSGQQDSMAKLLASVGAQGSQGVGNAGGQATAAAGQNPLDMRSTAALIGAMSRYNKAGATNPKAIGSAVQYQKPPDYDWYDSSSSVPGDNWYF